MVRVKRVIHRIELDIGKQSEKRVCQHWTHACPEDVQHLVVQGRVSGAQVIREWMLSGRFCCWSRFTFSDDLSVILIGIVNRRLLLGSEVVPNDSEDVWKQRREEAKHASKNCPDDAAFHLRAPILIASGAGTS